MINWICKLRALALGKALIRLRNAIPIAIAIHCVKSPNDACDARERICC